ncbi:MAG: alpha/beta hydrolase [Gammaproteobacteria bacterium]|nr:alpha/beta hydrolase [Gammaproteobacteria bacterium]MYD76027.1 alpha/beta hydrolase [Gammaproteobacteria bacterium]MYJ53265.1 alpha/beta hydrolase [Gammaproteobacteria bacterium]
MPNRKWLPGGTGELDTARISDNALGEWYEHCGKPEPGTLSWDDYHAMLHAIEHSFRHLPDIHRFRYLHPVRLQHPEFGTGKPYEVPISYSDTASECEPVITIGGLINTKHRFDFLANDTSADLRIIAIDLAGRGGSGWLSEQSDYNIETYIEQLLQFMDHLGLSSCTLLGSSLGGSISIRLAARYPDRVNRIILNDSGPYIPVERRQRRATAIARHYVFDTPAGMFRKTAISARNSGPAPDAVLLYNHHHKTRWSNEENGRVYRHDIRAMLAYRSEATRSLDQWSYWDQLQCPVLLLHGLESDAMLDETIDRMKSNPQLSVIHVHDTGHTPSLSDGDLNRKIAEWVLNDRAYSQDFHFRSRYRPENIFYRI